MFPSDDLARAAFRECGGDLRLEDVGTGASGACFVAEIPRLKPSWELDLSSPVLVVEDSPDSLETWLEILRKAGLTAAGFCDPLAVEPELRTVIADGHPFTLITDLIFQGHDQTGFDLLEIARPCTQAKKILSTSLADNADIQVLTANFGALLIPKHCLSQLQIRSRPD